MKDQKIFNPVDEVLKGGSQKLSAYKSFYPSDASCIVKGGVVGKCLRYQYWRWAGVEAPIRNTWRMALAMNLGDCTEKFFLELYQKAGMLKATQMPFFIQVMGLNISGRIDGITKKGELIECKSAYGTAFYKGVNQSPKLEHLCQIMVYLACLGLNECILPYICRDNPSKREGYLIRKKEIEALGITMVGIISRWKRLNKYKAKGETPPCDFDFKSWQCSYCLYREKCSYEKAQSV